MPFTLSSTTTPVLMTDIPVLGRGNDKLNSTSDNASGCWERNVRYRSADNSRPVSFTVSAWEWVYATNLSRLQRETRERERERNKQMAGEKGTQCTNKSDPITSTSELLLRRKCHCACSPISDSPTCAWPLCNRDSPAKIWSPTYTLSYTRFNIQNSQCHYMQSSKIICDRFINRISAKHKKRMDKTSKIHIFMA
jgi:hypothetical protein